ncbi:MAG: MgtC/SapB family protein [Candidatus Pacebacteria bacterium]|nr:MgtC/SapB family protein [Candidatus Paceibacterota bacterium]
MGASSTILFLSFKGLILAVILGALIGLEREWAQKSAGIRTFSFISLGAALFIIISRLSFERYLGVSNLDPSRTLGQIIIGVGFLGAGIIIFQPKENTIKNLTTAAMIWVTAAIGAAVGLELYWIAVFATFLVLFINIVIFPIEKKMEKRIQRIKDEKKEG